LYDEASLALSTKQALAAQSKHATAGRAASMCKDTQTVCRKRTLLAGPLRQLAESYSALLDTQGTLNSAA